MNVDKKETTKHDAMLRVLTEQMSRAGTASKCHSCGCFHKTVKALSSTEVGQSKLAGILEQARSLFKPKQYDCLGCPVCYPAIAMNAFAEAFPDLGPALDLCAMEQPEERQGWPPQPGEYHVMRYQAPVAVCTLNSEPMARHLRDDAPDGLAIVGTLHTENLGIERIIRNTVTNPNIRFLILCGEDAQQAIGHLPGQSLQCLFENGVDERGRIRGARGKRPYLKNVTAEEIRAFIEQVELIPMIGEQRAVVVGERAAACRKHDPGPYKQTATGAPLQVVQADEPRKVTLDPAGYFVVYPDRRKRCLVLEHYANEGLLDCVIEGRSSPALYHEAICRNLVSRLDHAAYLGRELERAERALETGKTYVQDKAPGEPLAEPVGSSCGCADSRGAGGES